MLYNYNILHIHSYLCFVENFKKKMNNTLQSYTVYSYCVDYLHTLLPIDNLNDNDMKKTISDIVDNGFDQNKYLLYIALKAYIDWNVWKSKSNNDDNNNKNDNFKTPSPPQSPVQILNSSLSSSPPPPNYDDDDIPTPPNSPQNNEIDSSNDGSVIISTNQENEQEEEKEKQEMEVEIENDKIKKKPQFTKNHITRSFIKNVNDITQDDDIISEVSLIDKLDNPELFLRKKKLLNKNNE